MTWKVELLDVFEHSWHTIGHYETREEAVAAAKRKYDALQPPPGVPDFSGGPHPPGLQDRIFVIPPSGGQDGWQYVGETAGETATASAPPPEVRRRFPDRVVRLTVAAIALAAVLLLFWIRTQ